MNDLKRYLFCYITMVYYKCFPDLESTFNDMLNFIVVWNILLDTVVYIFILLIF